MGPNNQCERCGACCIELVSHDKWKRSLLGESEIEMVSNIIKYLPYREKGCRALVKDDQYACLVQILFGHDAKPIDCQSFGGEPCEAIRK